MARVIFMGSPEIAVPSLRALHAAGHEIPCVVTQPDRPKGRGQTLSAPAVKLAALELGIPVLQPEKIKTPEFAAALAQYAPELIVVVAYGKILPPEVLKIPKICCVNLHFSLLPKYRGAACVAYALIHGDDETGVTTIVMEEGLDTGPILMQWSEPIQADDTTGSLSERLAALGAEQLLRTVAGLERGDIQATPQSSEGASYAPLLKKEEGRVDWSKEAGEIYKRYRGLSPWPGLFSFLNGKRVIFSELKPSTLSSQGLPGTLRLTSGGEVLVDCGEGCLELLKLKPEGKSVLSAKDFMRGLSGKNSLKFE